MIKTREFKKEIFPNPFVSILPKKCAECGGDIEISVTLTRMVCGNRRCKKKLVHRLQEYLRVQDIKGVTEQDLQGFIGKHKISSPYYIYLYNPNYDGEFSEGYGEKASGELFKELNKRRGLVLWEYVQGLSDMEYKKYIPKLLKGYTNIDTFYKDMEEGGAVYIQQRILERTELQDDTGLMVRAVKLYDYLTKEKKHILKGLEGVVILKPEVVYTVFFESKPQGYASTYEFIRESNKMYKSTEIRFVEVEDPNGEVNIVYWKGCTSGRETTRLQSFRLRGCKIVKDVGELRGL